MLFEEHTIGHCRLLLGDALAILPSFPPNSIDAICTDPPYLINFMGKDFDSQDGAHKSPQAMQAWHEQWARAVYRVLKPGAHLIAMGGSRTFHLLACALEDAGFELRDTLMWVYGSGFPKSANISKNIDKLLGAEREVIGEHRRHGGGSAVSGSMSGPLGTASFLPLTAPATDAARIWDGWGSALKPAFEAILLCRKPLGGATLAANVLRWGVGGLNIDGCRVPTSGEDFGDPQRFEGLHEHPGWDRPHKHDAALQEARLASQGRWPANILLTYPQDQYILKENISKELKNELYRWMSANT